jgi:hypothetical protein
MIDLGPAFDRIVASRLPDWDKEAVAAAMERVMDVWVEKDLAGAVVLATEQAGSDPFPYKIDLTLVQDGALLLIDWKTKRTGKLDDRWEMRETRSPQRKLYAAAALTLYGDKVEWPLRFHIRGVLLDEEVKNVKGKTLPFVISHAEAVEAVRHLRDQTALRDALIERGKYPWVRHEGGCRLYGDAYKCEFEDFCWNGLIPPPTDLVRIEKPLSHSSAKEFLRCPERFRLLKSMERRELEDDEEDTSSNAAGRVFHEIMEFIYRQAQQVNGHPNTPYQPE